jgi:hypothetical protein
MPAKIESREESDIFEPGESSTIVIADKYPATAEFLDQIAKGGAHYENVYFFGRIVYETLGREHHTDFCVYLLPFNAKINPDTIPDTASTEGLKTDSRFMLMQCDKWHTAD